MTGYFQTFSALSQAADYVVAMGDSRTAAKTGFWAGLPVVNIAVDGSTTASLISGQLPQLVALMGGAKFVFMDIGINDVRAIANDLTETLAQFQANAANIMQSIINSGAVSPSQLFVSNTAPFAGNDQPQFFSWFPTTLSVAQTWESLCQEYGAHLVDMLSVFTGGTDTINDVSPALYIPGGGHYSAGGWQYVDAAINTAMGA